MHSNKSVKAIVFDLGNVLIDIDMQQTVVSWAESTGATPEQVGAACRFDELYPRMECDLVDIEQLHREVAAALPGEIAFEDFLAGWNSILGPVYPQTPELLDSLAPLRLVCLSNTNAAHADVWKAYCADMLSRFERVFCSHEMGCRKPDAAIYRIVLEYLNLPPAQVAFIDDRAENVSAACELGIQGRQADGYEQVAAAIAGLSF